MSPLCHPDVIVAGIDASVQFPGGGVGMEASA